MFALDQFLQANVYFRDSRGSPVRHSVRSLVPQAFKAKLLNAFCHKMKVCELPKLRSEKAFRQ